MKGRGATLFFLVIFLFSDLITTSPIWSHSGRTDASGGHYNRKTGEYHYHRRPVQKKSPSPSYRKQDVYQETERKEGTVYVTRTGKKYHSPGCRYLRKSQRSIEINKAISLGYTPCSVCGGVPVKNSDE